MARVLGYMLTWTTYGTWLQGDEKGYVKNGRILGPDDRLYNKNRAMLSGGPVILSPTQRQTVQAAILAEADELNQTALALAAPADHVHLVLEYIPKPIGRVVSHYKNAAGRDMGEPRVNGKWWTKGYDKRYCFDKASLKSRITYVNNHKNSCIE